jgi:glycosyltransferase involved in cell wall biosynthesis
MKILVNRKPVAGPWGGGNLFLKSLYENLPKLGHEIVTKIEPNIDLILIINPRYDQLGISINEAIHYKQKHPQVKIIQRINDCDARKNTEGVDDMLIQCSEYLDATIFVSNWMKKYFLEKGWKCSRNFILFNGVKKVHEKVSKLNNGKINLVTHHWSDNYLKGFDVYDFLDDFVSSNSNFTFTYVGRERGTFKNSRVVSPLCGDDLHLELKKYDVYVSASRYDPGPNHILEAISCELPILVHCDGGGAVEFGMSKCKKNIFLDFKDLISKLERKCFLNSCFQIVNWDKSMLELNNILRQI